MKAPIKQRIRAAYDTHSMDARGCDYWTLIHAVFPDDDYPRAFIYSSNGGPPGCSMAFNRALREMHGSRNSSDRVYIPPAAT